MEKRSLRIKESFFNPILHIIPLLVFIIINHFFELKYAWTGGIIASIILTTYVWVRHRGLFKNFIATAVMFLIVALVMTLVSKLIKIDAIRDISNQIVFFIALFIPFIFRKKVIKVTLLLVSPTIPMGNNLNEFFKIMRIFIIATGGYLATYFIFRFTYHPQTDTYIFLLNLILTVILFLLTIYCFIRVKIIRSELAKEKWLPILTYEGKVIGSIQRVTSFTDNIKYTHPIVRGIIIRDEKVLLQETFSDGIFYPSEWDTFVSNHVEVGQTPEENIKKIAFDNFTIDNIRTFLLSKYIFDTPFEHQYVLTYVVADFTGELIPNLKKVKQMKWWTIPQIEENLTSGIFNEKFVKEWDLLKRTGLIRNDEDEEMEDFEIDAEEMKKYEDMMYKERN